MIDIHCHLIPGVDDGPQTLEESLAMLEMASKDGIHTAVATPHTFSAFSTFDMLEMMETVWVKYKNLKKHVAEKEIPIKILSGAENYFESGLLQHLKEMPDLLTINNSDYFLLEFPMDFVFPGTQRFIYDAMNEGYIPIICHPERNRGFQKNPMLLYQYMQMGALSQVTAGSLRGDFGGEVKRIAMEMLHFNLISIVASDGHKPDRRKPQLSYIYQVLKDVPKEKIDLLVEHVPAAVINNEAPPDTGALKNPQRKLSFFDFFK